MYRAEVEEMKVYAGKVTNNKYSLFCRPLVVQNALKRFKLYYECKNDNACSFIGYLSA